MSIGNVLMFMSPGSWIVERGLLDNPLGKILAVGYIAHWAWILPFAVLRTYVEDKVMREEFGTEWQEWAHYTPYKMIPFVF